MLHLHDRNKIVIYQTLIGNIEEGLNTFYV